MVLSASNSGPQDVINVIHAVVTGTEVFRSRQNEERERDGAEMTLVGPQHHSVLCANHSYYNLFPCFPGPTCLSASLHLQSNARFNSNLHHSSLKRANTIAICFVVPLLLCLLFLTYCLNFMPSLHKICHSRFETIQHVTFSSVQEKGKETCNQHDSSCSVSLALAFTSKLIQIKVIQ